MQSHSLWVRELKFVISIHLINRKLSHSLWVRELKSPEEPPAPEYRVALLVGA